MRQAIPPMDECRNDIDIFAELARARSASRATTTRPRRSGCASCTGDAVDDFRRLHASRASRASRRREDAVAFAREIRDPERHPFSTPSGKIEIYSTTLAAKPDPYGLGPIPPIPTWIPRPTSRRTLSAQSVLAEIAGAHALDPRQPAGPGAGRSATTSGCIPTTRRRAASRTAQTVRVFNDRGATVLPAQGHRPHRARRRLDQGGRLVHPRTPTGRTRRAAPTC